jgi:hypothetical protein
VSFGDVISSAPGKIVMLASWNGVYREAILLALWKDTVQNVTWQIMVAITTRNRWVECSEMMVNELE